MPSIVVHGGAGHEMDPQDRDGRRAGLRRAADAGWCVLAGGGSALDAAVAATVVLEDDPLFNAGRGSVLTDSGTVEMDASLMDGATLAAGAVAAVSRDWGTSDGTRLGRTVEFSALNIPTSAVSP